MREIFSKFRDVENFNPNVNFLLNRKSCIRKTSLFGCFGL